MTSAINPNNIDGTYPVAGQDNNSQGFRDNFTNTKTNFQYAAQEITELQGKVLLKSQLTGGDSLIVQNNMGGSPIINATLRDMAQTVVNLGQPDTANIEIDYSAGSFQKFTTAGSRTVNFVNFPDGNLGTLKLQITVANVSHQVTFGAGSSWINAVGIPGCTVSGPNAVITFPAVGTYEFEFESINNCTNITINQTNQLLQPLNNSKEALGASAAANLAVATSYFTTTTASVATLAAGVEGQVKTFAMYGDGGDMVITVTNAGWKSSGTGTITFDTVGDACVLQYINSKWFCIGNNGATFA